MDTFLEIESRMVDAWGWQGGRIGSEDIIDRVSVWDDKKLLEMYHFNHF